MDIKNQISEKLAVIWASSDPYVAERVALMFTHAARAKNMFDEVVLIVWGPSAKVAAENRAIINKIKEMKEDGVVLQACITCANEYGVAEELEKQGYEVKAMGGTLAEYLKSGVRVLTF